MYHKKLLRMLDFSNLLAYNVKYNRILTDKSKPAERQGRKAMDLRFANPDYDRQAAETGFFIG